MDEITLQEWAEQERKRFEAFIAEWNKSAAKDPENYPRKLTSGDWDEQFLAASGRLDS